MAWSGMAGSFEAVNEPSDVFKSKWNARRARSFPVFLNFSVFGFALNELRLFSFASHDGR